MDNQQLKLLFNELFNSNLILDNFPDIDEVKVEGVVQRTSGGYFILVKIKMKQKSYTDYVVAMEYRNYVEGILLDLGIGDENNTVALDKIYYE